MSEKKQEIWYFKGVLRCKGNKRGLEWVTADGQEMVYSYKRTTGAGSIVGHAYEVTVTRGSGGSCTMHGRPTWLDTTEHPPHEDKFKWEAQSRAEQCAWEDANTEKRMAKQENEFDSALAKLHAAYESCNAAQRRALLSYFTQRITRG